jgi:hypothetical protein
MGRRAAALILALTLNPAILRAQDIVLTVTAASADVYKGPSNVTPVIGHVARGAVLPVSRNLGSWVRVPWPDAADGTGYVHVTMGRIGGPQADTPMNAAAARRSAAPVTTTPAPNTRTSVGEPVMLRRQLNITPASHIVGIGGLIGSPTAFGGTARVWSRNRLGIQVGFTRDAITSDAAAGRVTSMQIEPGIVYGVVDRFSDYLWIRPYVGTVASLRHQTYSVAAPIVQPSTSDNGIGFRVFGGGELTFASLPQFGISGDVGYRRLPTPFVGFEPDRINVSISGHWYVK